MSETPPQTEDSLINNWYLAFTAVELGVKPSLSSYSDYSSIIKSVPDDILAMLSIEDGSLRISMLLENKTRDHAIKYGYTALVSAFESAKKTLTIKAAVIAIQKEIESATPEGMEPLMHDVSLEVIELERQLTTIRDIDSL